MSKNLRKNKNINVDQLATIMRSKDQYGNNKLTKQQVEDSMTEADIILDIEITERWMKSSKINGKRFYSIPALLQIVKKAIKKIDSEVHNKEVSSLQNESSSESFSLDPDSCWMTILELNSNLPVPKRKGTIVDIYLIQKNILQLKAAMYQSYHQYQGYLPPKDVVQLSLAYSTVFYLGLDQGGIRGAINWARSQDIKMGMVNIDKFVQALMENIE